jgi:transcriptional regulator GlxA family with amidase domain
MNVGILLFPDVEILDFAGPFEVFSVATRVFKRDRDPRRAPFEVFLVAQTSDLVAARYGVQVKPHYGFDEHPHIDLLLVPGGIVDQPRRNPQTIDWIRRTAAKAELVTSVCTGAFLLAQAGLLDGLHAATHWEDVGALRQEFPAVKVKDDQVWVDEGRVVTSAGIAAGIDMCLHLVGRLEDEELARAAARQMVYDWRADPSRGPSPSC